MITITRILTLALACALPAYSAPSTGTASFVFAGLPPGKAIGKTSDPTLTLSNNLLSFSLSSAGGRLQPLKLTETANGAVHDFADKPVFRVGLADTPGLPAPNGFVPCNLTSSDFTLVAPPRVEAIPANPKAVRAAEKSGGWRITANLRHTAGGLAAQWSAELRDDSHYLRQTLRLTGRSGTLTGVQALVTPVAGARDSGTAVAGNPAVTDSLFLGLEQPMSVNDFSDGAASGIACKLPVAKGVIYEFSSVIGVYPKTQLRRAFLMYLERERAAPYRQFLHYNGWFDFDRNVSEQGAIDVIQAYDRELVRKRGVPVNAFVIDDGWDDWNAGFWTINRKKFPNDFKSVGCELDRIKSRFGIWISPLAGYANAGERIGQAAKLGLTRDGSKSLDLSYEPYYKWFLDRTSKLITEDKVAYFKFDKAGDGVNPHFLALLRLCRELRKDDPQLVINITVGTWPSPFWLNHIDCTWREGNDMGWEGPGDDREQWITYRDAQTWRGVVSKGPLYPLNSIMNHGIVLSNGHFFAARAYKAGTDMKHEVRSFFGSGTLMQELYVKPAITTPAAWDEIAEAARWSRANADILVDTHWIGGNPSKGAEVYGWASWAPRKGLVTLRNPSDKEMEYPLDIAAAFELPDTAPKTYQVRSAYADTPSPIATAIAGKPEILKLAPFSVLVLEFTP